MLLRVFRAGLGRFGSTLMHSHHFPSLVISLNDARAVSETLLPVGGSEEEEEGEKVVLDVEDDDGEYEELEGGEGDERMDGRKGRRCVGMRLVKSEMVLEKGKVIKYGELIHRVQSFEDELDFVGMEVVGNGGKEVEENGIGAVEDWFEWKEVVLEEGKWFDWDVGGEEREERSGRREVAGRVLLAIDGGVLDTGDGDVVRIEKGGWILLGEKEDCIGTRPLRFRNRGRNQWWGFVVTVLTKC